MAFFRRSVVQSTRRLLHSYTPNRTFTQYRSRAIPVVQVSPRSHYPIPAQQAIAQQWTTYRRARRWRIARNIFFFSVGFVPVFLLLIPEEESILYEELAEDMEYLPMVQRLLEDAATKPFSQCYTEIDLQKDQSATLTEDTLKGSRLLGPQRAFWSGYNKELLLFAWFGWQLNGWPTVAHGGAIATVMSGAMSTAVGCIHPASGPLPDPTSLSLTYLKPTRVKDFYLIRVRPLTPSSAGMAGPSLPPAESSLDKEAHDIGPHKDLTKQPLPSEPPARGEDILEVEATLERLDGKVLVKARASFLRPG